MLKIIRFKWWIIINLKFSGPDLAVIGLGQQNNKFVKPEPKQFTKDLHNPEDMVLDQKDEEYIDSLIMTEDEVKDKALLWHKVNAGYLKEQKSKSTQFFY